MNAKIKQRWLKALRSGKYKQGRGQLKNGKSFCCLGVLCDIHRKTTKQTNWDGKYYLCNGYSLPQEVTDWAGLTDFDPTVGQASLATYNDGTKCSNGGPIKKHNFRQIAALIEKYL